MNTVANTSSKSDRTRNSGILRVRQTPLIKVLLQPMFGFPPDLDLAIHHSDEMFHYLTALYDGDWDKGLAAYFYSGLQAFTMTDQIVSWRFGGFQSIEMLDFASGYGRVTRHLIGRIDPENLTVSDIMPEAVRFQEQTFGVRGVISSAQPDQLDLPDQYDVIQAISLFSHLPEDLFRCWLLELWSHVKPGGILILSVHDASLRSDGKANERFLFVPTSENTDLDPATYGSTWVSSEFVTSAFEDELTGFSHVRLPRGLCGYQDAYVIVRQEGVDFSSLSYSSGVEGYIDVIECHRDSRLSCCGWAASVSRNEPLSGVDFVLNGEVIASTNSFSVRRDVASRFGDDRLAMTGWDLSVDLPTSISFSQDVAMIVARMGTSSSILSMGCIYSLLADSARANLKLLTGS